MINAKPHYYIDFETNKKKELFLIGLFADNNFSLTVCDSRLAAISSWPLYKNKFNIQLAQPKEYLTEILNLIKRTNGILIAYTEAEKLFLNEYLPKHQLADVPYVNLAVAARYWKNKYHAARFKSLGDFRKTASDFQKKGMPNSLASLMRLLEEDKQAPPDYAPGKTTMRIKSVIDGLNNCRNNHEFGKLTSVQKQKATKLLKHNHFDVMPNE